MSKNPTPAPLHRSPLFRLRRQLGSWLFAPVLAAAVFSGRHWDEGSAMDEVFDGLSVTLIVAGVAVRSWATLYIGGRKSRELVTDGPYGLCRNPLYLGSLLIGMSLAASLQSLTLGVAIALFGPLLYLPVVREEERVMRDVHGASFQAYLDRVPRLVPRSLRIPPSTRQLTVDLLALRRHAVRSLCILMLIPLGEIVAALQSDGQVPRLLGLP